MFKSYQGNYAKRGAKGGKKFGDQRNGFKSEMFETVCSRCSEACRVPFRPNGKKPVLCGNCFKKDGFSRDDKRGPSSISSGVERQLREINQKLDVILHALDR